MRSRFVQQLNEVFSESGPESVEALLFVGVSIDCQSRFAKHPCAVKSEGKVYMGYLDLVGLVMDGRPIAGIYDHQGRLTGFK
jgi:hypothetical protein